MNAALCREVGAGAFPTPAQVAACGAEQLQKRCGLGYRARTLCKLAEQVRSSEHPRMDATAWLRPAAMSKCSHLQGSTPAARLLLAVRAEWLQQPACWSDRLSYQVSTVAAGDCVVS